MMLTAQPDIPEAPKTKAVYPLLAMVGKPLLEGN